MRLPAHLCRSWLFVSGADEAALSRVAGSGADVLIQELEDFTPPDQRPKARAMAPEIYAKWRDVQAIAAVRINPLAQDGMDDLIAVMKGRPDIVALPKVSEPGQIVELDRAVTRLEKEYGIDEGATALLPNIELARGLVQTHLIAKSSPRIIGCLMASEDLAADLGVERTPDGAELKYCRQRFLVECVAAGTVAVDCPFTWSDSAGAERDVLWARQMGYKCKSAVDVAHIAMINKALTPSDSQILHAQNIVDAFERARAEGHGRAHLEGSQIEVPIYTTAIRLLKRAKELVERP